jgi:hypothetical protein
MRRPEQPLRAARARSFPSRPRRVVERPNQLSFKGMRASNRRAAYSLSAIRFRSMKMIFFAQCWRMSATISSTGFWNGFTPQAKGTTQKSQLWTHPRVASKTWVVT